MIDLGYIIGTLFTVALITVMVTLHRVGNRFVKRVGKDDIDGGMVWVGLWFLRIAIPATVAIWMAATWPSFDMAYHTWNPVTGTVETVDSRLAASGDGMEDKYVLTIDGQEYGCLDTRCTTVEVGDTVNLSCTKVFIYAGTPGYDCKWNE